MESTWPWSVVDHRVDGWPLMDSIQKPTIMFLGYLGMVYVGPKIMRNRKPMNVNGIMIGYNICLSLFNLYILTQFLIASYRLNYNWLCAPSGSTSTDHEEMRLVNGVYLFFVSKPIEWLDTFFFIIRKKTRQLTVLHVYHHSSIFVITWALSRWVPSGLTFVPMFMNSVVHVAMYSYYGLSALGPAMQKYLWWKKYLTLFQLVQFFIQFAHGLIALKCPTYNPLPSYVVVFYAISLLILFAIFYFQSYVKKSSPLNKDGVENIENDTQHNGKLLIDNDFNNKHNTNGLKHRSTT